MKFIETMTIEQFKELVKSNKIEVVRNPKTDKLFFVAGNVTGPVSDTYKEDPVISKCVGDEGDERTTEFYLLHKKGSNKENVIDTL